MPGKTKKLDTFQDVLDAVLLDNQNKLSTIKRFYQLLKSANDKSSMVLNFLKRAFSAEGLTLQEPSVINLFVPNSASESKSIYKLLQLILASNISVTEKNYSLSFVKAISNVLAQNIGKSKLIDSFASKIVNFLLKNYPTQDTSNAVLGLVAKSPSLLRSLKRSTVRKCFTSSQLVSLIEANPNEQFINAFIAKPRWWDVFGISRTGYGKLISVNDWRRLISSKSPALAPIQGLLKSTAKSFYKKESFIKISMPIVAETDRSPVTTSTLTETSLTVNSIDSLTSSLTASVSTSVTQDEVMESKPRLAEISATPKRVRELPEVDTPSSKRTKLGLLDFEKSIYESESDATNILKQPTTHIATQSAEDELVLSDIVINSPDKSAKDNLGSSDTIEEDELVLSDINIASPLKQSDNVAVVANTESPEQEDELVLSEVDVTSPNKLTKEIVITQVESENLEDELVLSEINIMSPSKASHNVTANDYVQDNSQEDDLVLSEIDVESTAKSVNNVETPANISQDELVLSEIDIDSSEDELVLSEINVDSPQRLNKSRTSGSNNCSMESNFDSDDFAADFEAFNRHWSHHPSQTLFSPEKGKSASINESISDEILAILNDGYEDLNLTDEDRIEFTSKFGNLNEARKINIEREKAFYAKLPIDDEAKHKFYMNLPDSDKDKLDYISQAKAFYSKVPVTEAEKQNFYDSLPIANLAKKDNSDGFYTDIKADYYQQMDQRLENRKDFYASLPVSDIDKQGYYDKLLNKCFNKQAQNTQDEENRSRPSLKI